MEKRGNSLQLFSLQGIPEVNPGDDVVSVLLTALKRNKINLKNDDVLVIAQKIISKAEGRYRYLGEVEPTPDALHYAEITGKDPRLLTLILSESNVVLRARQGLIIVEHKLGFVCANAGIDHSNVHGAYGNQEEWVLLLPENPDRSAERIRSGLKAALGVDVGVSIIDSHGRAWRLGTVGTTIGLSAVPAVVDMRVVHVRGFPYPLVADGKSKLSDLIRPKDLDLFR